MNFNKGGGKMEKEKKREIIIDPTSEERKENGYYFHEFYCSNCGRPSSMFDGGINVMIKEGKLVPKTVFICPNCKCRTLKAE